MTERTGLRNDPEPCALPADDHGGDIHAASSTRTSGSRAAEGISVASDILPREAAAHTVHQFVSEHV